MGVPTMVDKPKFDKDQLVTSVDARNFGRIRKRLKEISKPLFITNKGLLDTVLMDYDYFEALYMRLQELEEFLEAKMLIERTVELENNPGAAIPLSEVLRKHGGLDD